ncbi:uncharacterized protein LOC126409948 [Nymphaea colorata]|nr:uncharacterized protein LOC126409948 [Nymphaea colorata]
MLFYPFLDKLHPTFAIIETRSTLELLSTARCSKVVSIIQQLEFEKRVFLSEIIGVKARKRLSQSQSVKVNHSLFIKASLSDDNDAISCVINSHAYWILVAQNMQSKYSTNSPSIFL